MRPTRVPPRAARSLGLVALLAAPLGSCGGDRAGDAGGEAADPTPGPAQAATADSAPPADVPPGGEPAAPPRAKLGAMRSVQIVSDVLFEGFPDQPHTLDFTCAFPLRSRMELAGASGAQVRYQFGERLWALDRPSRPLPGEEREPPASQELDGDAMAEQVLDFAARRALYLWPDEGHFEGDGLTRTSPAPGRAGVLVATLHRTSGRPVDLRGFDATGRCTVQLVVDEWFEAEGRTWPRRVRLMDGDATVWTETTRTVDGRWFHGDATFVPTDERVRELGTKIGALVVREFPRAYVLDLPFAPVKGPGETAGQTAGQTVGQTAGEAATVIAPGASGGPASVRAALDLAALRWAELEAHLAASGAPVPPARTAAVTLDRKGAPHGLRFTVPAEGTTPPPPAFHGVEWSERPLVFGWRLLLDGDVPDAGALELVRREAAEGDGRSPEDVDVSIRIEIAPGSGGNPPHRTGRAALIGLCAPVGPGRPDGEEEPGAGSTYDSLGDGSPQPLEFVPPRLGVRPSTPGDDPPR